jgi:hypothetical protein
MAEELKDKQQAGGQDDNLQGGQGDDETKHKDQTDPTQGKDQDQEGKTLTTEEVNEIVQKRINETKAKFSDYGDLKAKLEEYENAENERKRSEQSELENLQQDLGVKDEELNTYKTQLEQLQEQIKTDKVHRAFEAKAREAGIAYIDDAKALTDLSKVEVTDDGVQGIEEIVKDLVENKPFLIKQSEGQRQIGGASNGNDNQKADETAEELLRKAAEKARKSGRLEDKVAYVNLKAELTQ